MNTIKEIQQWKWKKDERTNTYLEEPVPFFDDAMAMLRYSIEEERKAKPKLKQKPERRAVKCYFDYHQKKN